MGLISDGYRDAVPEWMIGKDLRLYDSLTEIFALIANAELDIGTKVMKIFNDAKAGQWKEATFQASYDGPKASDGPIEARVAFLYTKAAGPTTKGKKGDYIALFYLAVRSFNNRFFHTLKPETRFTMAQREVFIMIEGARFTPFNSAKRR
jgi:hypothetical protein